MSEPARDPRTDRERLVGAAYATPTPLLARANLYEYELDHVPFSHWVLDHVTARRPLAPDDRVVDVGCGPGGYLIEVARRSPGAITIGCDLSAGMARAAASSGAPTIVADAMALPVQTGSCALVLAMHMLYHVPDIEQAASELARIVRADGVVAVVTNGTAHLAELFAVLDDAYAEVCGTRGLRPARSSDRFAFEDAPARLAPALTPAASHPHAGTIVVDAVEPLVAYVESMRSLYEPSLPAGAGWDAIVASAARRFAAAVDRDGAFTTHSSVGLLLLTRR